MKFQDFTQRLEALQQAYDLSVGRKHSQDSFGHWVRKLSRYLTYVFYRVGLKGPHILAGHILTDWLAVAALATHHVLTFAVLMVISHVLDNCDGDLARARNEADPKWEKFDHLGHTIANNAFWVVVALAYGQGEYTVLVVILLAARAILSFFRWVAGRREYGHKSGVWAFLAWPTNINAQHIGFALAVLFAMTYEYVLFFTWYYLFAALGRSLVAVKETWGKPK